MKETIEAVVWDLDGTLADSVSDIADSVNAVLQDAGLSPLPVEDIRLMVGHGAGKLLERAFAAAQGMKRYNAEDAYQGFLLPYERNNCVHTELYPGVREVLEQFRERGVVQAVCTNKPEKITRLILSELSVVAYFPVVIGGDTTARRKPDPLPLLTCIEQLGADRQRVLMVGDSAADVGAATASGVRVAYVPWGYSSATAEELNADYQVTSISDVLDYL